jgi:hypothetical protein
MDRSAIAKALAKAQAYQQCGKPEQAAWWVSRLVCLLDQAELLSDEALRDYVQQRPEAE